MSPTPSLCISILHSGVWKQSGDELRQRLETVSGQSDVDSVGGRATVGESGRRIVRGRRPLHPDLVAKHDYRALGASRVAAKTNSDARQF